MPEVELRLLMKLLLYKNDTGNQYILYVSEIKSEIITDS